jgi:hypothetical protein
MRLIILLIICVLFSNSIFSQFWGDAASCQKNVNDPAFQNGNRNMVIRSVFKLFIEGGCTGTLINRNTTDSQLGYYFLTAHHCVEGVNFDNEHVLYFNYQSPDANSSSTPISNRGIADEQSQNDPNNPAYEYRHHTKLRLVDGYVWGDFALCEILTPLPPHFNVYFAGWNPSLFVNGVSIGTPPSCGTNPNLFVGIHHPEEDIKKISGTQKIIETYTSLSTGCYTVTTIIDVLFGWIWGHSVSTQVICNYIDAPWYTIPYWCYGSVQEGSSGSPLFNSGNKIVGQLSGGFSSCSSSPAGEFYGRFKNNYFRQSVKNTLNPSNELAVDLAGMDGRQISCYPNLTLPGGNSEMQDYFPASHYQDENTITLQAEHRIETVGTLRIHSGANYKFQAGDEIVLTDGFEVQAGAEFSATIVPCVSNKMEESPASSAMNNIKNRIANMDFPKSMDFDISKYSNHNNLTYKPEKIMLLVYPNPNKGRFTADITLFDKEINSVQVSLNNAIGINILKFDLSRSTTENNKIIKEFSDIPAGFYTVTFKATNYTKTIKVIVE